MGYTFGLGHSNLVAYLTNEAATPPASEKWCINELLDGLRNKGLISRTEEWLRKIRTLADVAEARLEIHADADGRVAPAGVDAVLGDLRLQFRSFAVHALLVPGVTPATRGAAERFALSGEDVLVLMPDARTGRPAKHAPVTAATLMEFEVAMPHARHRAAGMVIWNRLGTAAFVPVERLEHVIDEVTTAMGSPDAGALDRLLDNLGAQDKRRLLHLSDLHFGREEALHNKPLLEAELHDAVKNVDRVVITGDLFDNPDNAGRAAFNDFRMSLLRICGRPPVIVPGNHDQRWLGNIGQSFAQISQIPHAPVEADDAARVVFLSLNSSISGRFARGEVTSEQLLTVGTEYRNLLAARPETHAYLPVVLVHHHPFSFGTPPSTWYQRFLAILGSSDETFLLMEDASLFLEWCARWRISAVLHGHKHQPRYHSQVILPEGSPGHPVTAIGCGSSLGAEQFPLSYNIVYWDDHRRIWLAKYFESRAGGPFVPKALTSAQLIPQPAAAH